MQPELTSGLATSLFVLGDDQIRHHLLICTSSLDSVHLSD